MADTHPDYWKFCTLMERINTAQTRLQAARAQLFAEHGLDPAKDYDLNDEQETITERPRG